MTKLKRSLDLIAAVLSLAAAFAVLKAAGLPNRADYSGYLNDRGRRVAPEIGMRAPSFALRTSTSRQIKLEQARGRTTIINFWATWCGPCRREMTELQKLYETESGKLRVLAINLGDDPAAVRAWVRQLGLTYDVLLDQRGTVSRLYNLRGLPMTFMLDETLVIQRVYFGPVPIAQLARAIARL